jgi:esterase/lipase
MILDWLIFPSPDSSYTTEKTNGELIYVPKNFEPDLIVEKINRSNANHIPCLFLRATNISVCPKFAIFFHGNAEDINLAYEILNHLRFTLSINVLAPEYPGYGIYPGRPNQEAIFEDSLILYDYLTKVLNISPNNIIIFGRSLGTSPGTYLASNRKVTSLVLISPMISIRTVVKDIMGTLISYFIKDRFETIKMIEKVVNPILIIHGQNDNLIRYYHSTELYNKALAPCELILPENMDHNEFDFFQEFSEPLLDFISRNGIFANTEPCSAKFPPNLFKVPEEFKIPIKQWNCLTSLMKKFSLA